MTGSPLDAGSLSGNVLLLLPFEPYYDSDDGQRMRKGGGSWGGLQGPCVLDLLVTASKS